MTNKETNNDFDPEKMDPSVPTDLLELFVDLEEAGISPEEFKETYG